MTPSRPSTPIRPAPGPSAAPAIRVVVLGSTGSIGVNTLAVIDHLNQGGHGRWRVVGLAAGTNAAALATQSRRYPGAATALADGQTDDPTFLGPDAAWQLVQEVDADLVVSAIVGFGGLRPTAAALARGTRVALANKETLVAGGRWVTGLAAAHGAVIDPIDSEHAAIAQCLAAAAGRTDAVARITLTASGGPFLRADANTLDAATPDAALNHPTWDMGPKITVDSATLMNKTLEVIEAHHLFGLPAEQIDVVVHPQSVVHGFVEFCDGSVLAQLGPPDMRGAIQHALTAPALPARAPGAGPRLNLAALGDLSFEPPDEHRFPALALARRVIAADGTAGATLNGANEAAVHAFLKRQLPFTRIVPLVTAALDALPPKPVTDYDDIAAADADARGWVNQQISAPDPAANT